MEHPSRGAIMWFTGLPTAEQATTAAGASLHGLAEAVLDDRALEPAYAEAVFR
jgi:hypothetical protein